MKNLARAEEMAHLLDTYVSAVARMMHLQLLPRGQRGRDHREQLAQAVAEVMDLTILHQTNPPSAELDPGLPRVTDIVPFFHVRG